MNVIPFVDIMLVLLTIVLTTSSSIAAGRIPVNLPQASKSVTDADKAAIIKPVQLREICISTTGRSLWNP